MFPGRERATLGTLPTPTMLGSVVVMVPEPRLAARGFRVRLVKNEFSKSERQGNRAREIAASKSAEALFRYGALSWQILREKDSKMEKNPQNVLKKMRKENF